MKRKIIGALNKVEDCDKSGIEYTRRVEFKTDDFSELVGKGLEYFASAETKTFFHRFNFSTAFLSTDPSGWSGNEEFKNG